MQLNSLFQPFGSSKGSEDIVRTQVNIGKRKSVSEVFIIRFNKKKIIIIVIIIIINNDNDNNKTNLSVECFSFSIFFKVQYAGDPYA